MFSCACNPSHGGQANTRPGGVSSPLRTPGEEGEEGEEADGPLAELVTLAMKQQQERTVETGPVRAPRLFDGFTASRSSV